MRPVPSVATRPPPPDDFQAYPTASPSHQVLGLYQRILKQGRMSALDRAPPADQPRLRRELLALAAKNAVRGKGRHARNRALSLGKALLAETKDGLGDLEPRLVGLALEALVKVPARKSPALALLADAASRGLVAPKSLQDAMTALLQRFPESLLDGRQDAWIRTWGDAGLPCSPDVLPQLLQSRGSSASAAFLEQLRAEEPLDGIAGAPLEPPLERLRFVRDCLRDLPPTLQRSIDGRHLYDWVEATLGAMTRRGETVFRVKDQRECIPVAWELLSLLPSSTQRYHALLSSLHSPHHTAFRSWLIEPERTAPMPGLECLGLPVLPQEQPGADHEATPTRVRHRTAVHLGPGGARYVKGPHDPASPEGQSALPDRFPREGALWNLLYQGDADVHGAIVLRDDAGKAKLMYGHRHEELFGQYAADWKPASATELMAWNERLVQRLVRLLKLGFGYRSLTELFHDRLDHQPLAPSDVFVVGCIDDLPRSMRYSNLRAGGWLADLAPEHMEAYGAAALRDPTDDSPPPPTWGPTQRQLAKLIDVQAVQLALPSAWTARERGWPVTELTGSLRSLGGAWARALALPEPDWEPALPLTLETCAREALHAMSHLQNGIDLGHEHGPVSTPGLFAFAETVAQKTVEALAATR